MKKNVVMTVISVLVLLVVFGCGDSSSPTVYSIDRQWSRTISTGVGIDINFELWDKENAGGKISIRNYAGEEIFVDIAFVESVEAVCSGWHWRDIIYRGTISTEETFVAKFSDLRYGNTITIAISRGTGVIYSKVHVIDDTSEGQDCG